MSTYQIEAIITGRVQAVGFRRFVHREAREIGGLVGFAENLKNRSVRVIARGEKSGLEALITRLESGPFIARVDKVQVTWQGEGEEMIPPAGEPLSYLHLSELPEF